MARPHQSRPFRGNALTEKPIREMTEAECRQEYAAIRERWGYARSAEKRRQFNEAIRARMSYEIVPESPHAWITYAREYSEPCWKCSGSGTFRWGPMVNGICRYSGECFMCGGKGSCNDADNRRNWGYWNHYAAIHPT